jgi:Icc-related predicted phosphoesterase
MLLLVYSDLHLDHYSFQPTLADGSRADKDADVVVLAGDIDEGTRGIRWARESFADKPIVYVAGNHEFYGKHWTKHLDDMREAANKFDVCFLEADGIDIGGVRFLGCTLWTDFELFGEEKKRFAMYHAKSNMNDYKEIKISRMPEMYWVTGKYLVPELTVFRHRGSVEWLARKLAKGDPAKTVVITHHAPHPKSVPARYKDHFLTPAYASDLSRLMGKAALWIHGHMHDAEEYTVEGTRVICNPRGYTHRNGGFDNALFQPNGIWEV